jgi:hypothetical protein
MSRHAHGCHFPADVVDGGAVASGPVAGIDRVLHGDLYAFAR